MRRTVAIGLALATVAITLLALAIIAVSWGVPLPEAWGFRGSTAIISLITASVGLLIALRRPTHPVGWLFLAAGLLAALGLFGEEYLILSYFAGREPLPGASWLGWLNVWTWVPTLACGVCLTPLYFPDGRLPAPSWRPAVWLTVVTTVITTVAVMLDPVQVTLNMRGAPPPYDVRSLGPIAEASSAVFGFVGFPLLTLSMCVASVSVVRRFRRARGAERQQIKWFALGALCVAAGGALNMLGKLALAVIGESSYGSSFVWKLFEYPFMAALAFLLATVGLAILRYRLYDVDLVINRALVYGPLTALVAATYVVVVVLSQAVLRPLTGGSEIAVAGSTLVVVGLFQPLRARIQQAVDHRFYRSRYDAARTLDAFGVRLRDEVDLARLRSDLLDVVGTTVRPAHASVWLREGR